MARAQRYINPLSGSHDNNGSDWSANAWLDFSDVNGSSIDLWVEPGVTIFTSATSQINNRSQITIRQRTAGAKPIVTSYNNLANTLTWIAISTDDFTATTTGPSTNLWRAVTPDEAQFVGLGSLDAVRDAYDATTQWNANAEHVRVRYIDTAGTIRPTARPGRRGQFCTTNTPHLIVYSEGHPDTYYSGGIYVGYGAAVKSLNCSAVEFHDLSFRNCGEGIQFAQTQATTSSNLVQSCEFIACGNGVHNANSTNTSGQGQVVVRESLFQYTQRHGAFFSGFVQDSYVSSCSFEKTGLHGGAGVRFENTHQSAGQPFRCFDNTFRQFSNNIFFTGDDGGAFYADSSTILTEFYRNACYDGKAAYRNNSGRPGHHAYMNFFSSVDIAFAISDGDGHNSASLTLANNTIYGVYRAHGTASANLSGAQPDAAFYINQFAQGTVRVLNNLVVGNSGALYFGCAMEPGSASVVCVEANNLMSGVQAIKACVSAAGFRAQTVNASSTLADAGLASADSPRLSAANSKAVGWGASLAGFNDVQDFFGRFPCGPVPAGCTFFVPKGPSNRTGL